MISSIWGFLFSCLFVCLFFKRLTLVHIYSLLIPSNVILELLKPTFCLGDPTLTNSPLFISLSHIVAFSGNFRGFPGWFGVFTPLRKPSAELRRRLPTSRWRRVYFWLRGCDVTRPDISSTVCAR